MSGKKNGSGFDRQKAERKKALSLLLVGAICSSTVNLSFAEELLQTSPQSLQAARRTAAQSTSAQRTATPSSVRRGGSTGTVKVSNTSSSASSSANGTKSAAGRADTVGQWYQAGDGNWYYRRQDGGNWTGWIVSNQEWYYLGADGKMVTGWQFINGKWYYFHTVSDGTKGRMWANATTPDGYHVGADGASTDRASLLAETPGQWYQAWDGNWYFRGLDNSLWTGWIVSNQDWYYLGQDGKMLTGWQLISGKWYYFHTVSDGTKGRMWANATTPDGYYVDKDGASAQRSAERPETPGTWREAGGGIWYFHDPSGSIRTGWVVYLHDWYYLGQNGQMVTGWQFINGKWYYFHTVSDGTKGRMWENATTPDGYHVGADGSWDGNPRA